MRASLKAWSTIAVWQEWEYFWEEDSEEEDFEDDQVIERSSAEMSIWHSSVQ